MRAVGMIAEFNPLHHGHVLAMQRAKALSHADALVVVMAGNFVQRGEPAIVDKWHRAQAALACGADLVVELPTTDAVQAAGEFAAGGVALLAGLGVQALAFGTEAPDVAYLALAQKMQEVPPAKQHFSDFTQTYATQLNQYYQQAAGVALDQPNLLLGMSYAQAVVAQGLTMQLLPFARTAVGHDATQVSGRFASGSQLRATLASGQSISRWVPPASIQALEARHQSWADLFSWLKYRLMTADLAALRQIAGMGEGLEYRLTQQVATSRDFTNFLAAIKSKRYTYARLRRLALNVVLNQTQEAVAQARRQRYLQVLGFTAVGRLYLNQVKKHLPYPLITRPSAAQLAPGGLLAHQQRADNLIEMLTHTRQNYGRIPVMTD